MKFLDGWPLPSATPEEVEWLYVWMDPDRLVSLPDGWEPTEVPGLYRHPPT